MIADCIIHLSEFKAEPGFGGRYEPWRLGSHGTWICRNAAATTVIPVTGCSNLSGHKVQHTALSK